MNPLDSEERCDFLYLNFVRKNVHFIYHAESTNLNEQVLLRMQSYLHY